MSTTIPHPKQIEADAAAADRRVHRAAMKRLVQELNEQGIRFVEISPFNFKTRKYAREGRMTIAYMVHHRNVVMVSTALCHPEDDFDKLTGRTRAGLNLLEQRAVLLRVPTPDGMSMKRALADMFTRDID